MLRGNLQGQKLLLIGGINPAADLIELAHRNGVFLGVTDYNQDTYIKRIADAAYDINAMNVDALVQLCKDEHYNGIISNFNDMLSPYVAQVAEKLGMYSPYDIEQLQMSTDKKYFKKTCIQYGVPVPKEYKIEDENNTAISKISYPVIIKPVDGSGSKGITVCHNEKELKLGLQKAKMASRAGDVIVEEYLPYDEINVTYIAQNGNIQLAAIHDRYFNTSQEGVVRVPDLYIYPSRYTDIYLEKFNVSVIKMLQGIGIKNGSLFMQAVVKDGEIYFYEAGMRLNGCKTYSILEVENDYNTFEHLMHYALTGSMGAPCVFTPKMKKWYATWNVVGVPGGLCNRFVGEEELKTYPWIIKIAKAYSEGERIPESARGTLLQLIARIHLYGDTKEQLFERLQKTQTMFQVEDEDGRNILMEPHSIDDLHNKLNYDL